MSRSDHAILLSLIGMAETILARQYESPALIEPLDALTDEVRAADHRPAVERRTITDAEIILVMALRQLAAGTEAGREVMARYRYREIAMHALQMARAHAFIAFEQERGNR